LWRFVADAEALSRGVGHRPVRLDRDHLVHDILWRTVVDMCLQLVEGFAADTAVAAVLEQEYRAFARLGYSSVERLDVLQGRQ
jgi:hypothetical protein